MSALLDEMRLLSELGIDEKYERAIKVIRARATAGYRVASFEWCSQLMNILKADGFTATRSPLGQHLEVSW